MFEKKTTIILGAGASAHLGYPTGAKLIEGIINSPPFRAHCKGLDVYKTFVTRLEEIDPLSIDTFLSYNQEFIDEDNHNIGRKAITYELLQFEDNSIEKFCYDENGEPVENWYRYLVDALITGCSESSDLLKNIDNLTIATFNYDLSLEYYLYTRLNNISFFDKKDRDDFFEQIKIIHVYGQLGAFNWHESFCNKMYIDTHRPIYRDITSYLKHPHDDLIYNLRQYASSIEVVGTEKWKPENTPHHIKRIQKLIYKAEALFILGFGFYEDNIQLIGLDKVLDTSDRKIYYTNHGDHQIIERRICYQENGRLNRIKSTKKIAPALKEDFKLIDYSSVPTPRVSSLGG